jgi:hypothetical protein
MSRFAKWCNKVWSLTKHHLYLIPLACVALLFLPTPAKADVTTIISFLQTITSTLQNGIGDVLSGLNQLDADVATFHQEVIWPVTLINQATNFVTSSENQFRDPLSQIRNASVNSATLPNAAQLETSVRGANAQDLSQVLAKYTTVYGQVPPPAQAPPAERNMMDVDDAIAAGALKTSVISDQSANRMLDLSDALAQQTASSAPGSAPIISAQAQIASLENQALLAKNLAVELRVEATKLAQDNALLKKSAEHTGALKQKLQQLMTHP